MQNQLKSDGHNNLLFNLEYKFRLWKIYIYLESKTKVVEEDSLFPINFHNENLLLLLLLLLLLFLFFFIFIFYFFILYIYILPEKFPRREWELNMQSDSNPCKIRSRLTIIITYYLILNINLYSNLKRSLPHIRIANNNRTDANARGYLKVIISLCGCGYC
jgi:hypothetical protein